MKWQSDEDAEHFFRLLDTYVQESIDYAIRKQAAGIYGDTVPEPSEETRNNLRQEITLLFQRLRVR
jgi:hypothetical protein